MRGLGGLVLLGLCLTFYSCRALPHAEHGGLDLGRRVDNGTEEVEGCAPCEPELCPETRGCRAGLVPDRCGCCMECGNLEGQACDPGNRSVFYGLCGTGLRCQVDPRYAGQGGEEEEDEEEKVCVCEQHEPVCGTDDVTYMNKCQFKEVAFSRPELRTRGQGPCKTAPIIKVPPVSQVNGSGSVPVFLCEVFAFPMALVEWRKEGQDVVLPGDDPHISVQVITFTWGSIYLGGSVSCLVGCKSRREFNPRGMDLTSDGQVQSMKAGIEPGFASYQGETTFTKSRGGPLKFELSSWLQIEGAGPEDSGTYYCIAHNNLGSVSASAMLGILGTDELSSYLANSMSEMKQLMGATDYDQDFY